MTYLRSTILALFAASTFAQAGIIYGDAAGTADDTVTSQEHFDIKSVEVSNTGTLLRFKINVGAPPTASGGARYLIALDCDPKLSSSGSPPMWFERITMPGSDYFLMDGMDSNDDEFWRWSQANQSWSALESIPTTSSAGNSFTFEVLNSDLPTGVSTIKFDVYTSYNGAGGAFDALSSTNQLTAGSPYITSEGFSYTLTAVPEPAHYGLICAAGLIGIASFQTWRKRTTAAP